LRPTFAPSDADRERGFALYVVGEGKAAQASQLSFDATPAGADSRWAMLTALAKVQQAFASQSLAPDLWWGDVKVAARGNSNLQVVSKDRAAAQRLTAMWRDGVREAMWFASEKAAAPPTTVLVLAHRPDDEELRGFVPCANGNH
jgi:hypothetical protein